MSFYSLFLTLFCTWQKNLPIEHVIPYVVLLDILLHNAFQQEALSNCATESNTGLIYNVNILGEGELACCDSPSVLCSIGMDHPPLPCRPRISFTLKDQCFYY